MFGSKTEEVRGHRKWHNEERHSLLPVQNTVIMLKTGKWRCLKHVIHKENNTIIG